MLKLIGYLHFKKWQKKASKDFGFINNKYLKNFCKNCKHCCFKSGFLSKTKISQCLFLYFIKVKSLKPMCTFQFLIKNQLKVNIKLIILDHLKVIFHLKGCFWNENVNGMFNELCSVQF